MDYDWTDLAFADKKPLSSLDAIFIAAPRRISPLRFQQIVRRYLPKGNIVVGLAKEPYVAGFEGQPQFATLDGDTLAPLITAVRNQGTAHQLYTLHYSQRDLPHILAKVDFSRLLLVNGSWQYSFHTTEAFYAAVKKGLPYKFIPAFASEAEARAYERRARGELEALFAITPGTHTQAELLDIVARAAKFSFDYSFQTGAALAHRTPGGSTKRAGADNAAGGTYDLLCWAYNKVVPYETYALLHGAAREAHLSPPGDLNHYDAVHAEVALIIQAQKQGLPLAGASLFINLLPCPTCARMLAETDIREVVYTLDHSEGYAVRMLEMAGKKVRRIVP